jgi:hypothetical protein
MFPKERITIGIPMEKLNHSPVHKIVDFFRLFDLMFHVMKISSQEKFSGLRFGRLYPSVPAFFF